MATDPEKEVIYFGRTDFRNTNRLFGIKRSDRRQHMYVVGKTGTGKSAMLSNMIIQDIANGEGVCVVDPHGELVEGILTKIPHDRVNDVIYFNPADTESHIGFNILELPDPKYKHLVASGLMGIFTKIWAGTWSARMEYILNNSILALLETPGTTLLGIPRMLVDKDYRQEIIKNITDPVVKAFWISEYEQWKDQFRNEAIAPIQNKVGQFLSTALIRNVVGQPKSTIDIFDIMNSGKIFLVNVSKGRIGEDNSALLGAMIITKIQLAAMERVRVPEDERVDFYLYVDEFQNFATDSFAGILSEARKYRLDLILAHQYVGQLITMGATMTSTKVRDAIFGNVGTMIIFRVGAADAEFLENEFDPEFTPQDVVNLPNYCIYLKLMVDGVTSRPFSAATLPPFKVQSSSVAIDEVIQNSRKRYARPRQVIEDEINRWSGVMVGSSGGEVTSEGSVAFMAVCSSCGKETKVPFEPTPGRPIYCKDCLQKIKSGDMKPLPSVHVPIPKSKKESYNADLAGLGIEFEVKEEHPEETRFAPSVVTKSHPKEPRPAYSGAPRRSDGDGDIKRNYSTLGPVKERKSNILPIGDNYIEVKDESPEEAITLSRLKLDDTEKKPKLKFERPEIDINELRAAIKQSLNQDLAEPPPKIPKAE
jgi:CxxC-x17-CxxC domain-containing protein